MASNSVFGLSVPKFMYNEHIVIIPLTTDQNYFYKALETKLEDLNATLKQSWEIKVMNVSSCGDKLVVCIKKEIASTFQINKLILL
jgi:hypothetical protein